MTPPSNFPRLRLGRVELDTPVLAAPIAGFTDSVFRRIVRHYGGCGLIYTEMVSAEGWINGQVLPPRLNGVDDEVRPLGVQLWDRDEAHLEEAAGRLADLGVSVIDLNFGCPKKRIMGRHASGAALLRDPSTVGRLVAATVRGAGDVPVTAKMRLGPAIDRRTAPAVARAAQDNGAVAVTVHGRCADQLYSEVSRPDFIAEVAQAVSIPVIANGDIRDASSAIAAMRTSGAAGVMVAREAISRPWVFREITAALRGLPIPPRPTLEDQKQQLLAHHAAMVECHGDAHGTMLMRKFACRYLVGVQGNARFRNAISRAQNAAHFQDIVESFLPSDDADPAGVSLSMAVDAPA